jgi:hypothetical protein
MRKLHRACLAGVLILLTACASTPPAAKVDAAAAEKEIMQRVDSLIARYSQNDQAGVLAMLDPDGFVILGTTPAEVFRTPDEVRGLMSGVFAQFKSASYTDVRQIDVRSDGTLATAFFTVNFSPGTGFSLPLRLCTTWRKVNGEWLLMQSASAVMPG